MSVEKGFEDLLGRRVLVMGDVGTGKTRLTLRLLKEAVDLGFSDRITVIDMAPATVQVRGIKVGGRLEEISPRLKGLRYLTPIRVETPRLSARSPGELLELVCLNEKRIKPLLEKYLDHPTPILFVNDISIYLQSGRYQSILSIATSCDTFIANGYYGVTLESVLENQVSRKERNLMERLAGKMDVVIRL